MNLLAYKSLKGFPKSSGNYFQTEPGGSYHKLLSGLGEANLYAAVQFKGIKKIKVTFYYITLPDPNLLYLQCS